jgi:hypothetical protein
LRIARDQLDAGDGGFGILFGCHGAGAMLRALLLPYLRTRFGPDQLLFGGTLLAQNYGDRDGDVRRGSECG